MSEQHKTRQAEQLKQRFAKYSDSPNRVAVPKAGWKRFFLVLLVLKRVPEISAHFQSRQAKAPFLMTGAVRWFIPTPANGLNDLALLTITGFAEACRHVVVKLNTWEAHALAPHGRANSNCWTRCRKALSRRSFTARVISCEVDLDFELHFTFEAAEARALFLAMSALTVEISVSPAADLSILPARDENSTTTADIALFLINSYVVRQQTACLGEA